MFPELLVSEWLPSNCEWVSVLLLYEYLCPFSDAWFVLLHKVNNQWYAAINNQLVQYCTHNIHQNLTLEDVPVNYG